ncbi:MAG: tetratricopeptide repeat protein [Cyclobacteriaceae bacterium]|nr:tetratricopeptide repeat protein [Cyclobacteriaceae bacterium]
MNPDRVEMLKKYMQEDADDPFPVYALALEYQATDAEKARALFELLLTNHPHYLPTYYMAGIFFIQCNQTDQGISILKRGLEIAKAQHNTSTVREIQGVLDNLE